jgi:hypothetical protein
MKRILALLASAALVASLAACAKAPTEEINATKAAIDAAVAEGAEKYTPEDLKMVNDQMTAAQEEIKVQEGKFFKNFDKAKQILVKAKADAEALKGKVGTVKEEMKNNAVTLLGEATTAVADAKAMLDKAPRGKGSAADIEAMKADVAGLEEALNEIQPLIDQGEYPMAIEKATAIKTRATAVSDEIKAAQEKMGKK